MLHITFNSIKFHEACSEGYDPLSNYLGGDSNYGMDTPISLIKCLESNPIKDVIWALRATLEDSKEFSKQFAIACAEHVLPIFEKEFPEDNRPRKAIEAAKAGKVTPEIIEAAKAGKVTPEIIDAAYYAYSAYYAAIAAASATAYCAATAADAAAAAAAYYAAASAYCTTAAERQWQKELLIKMLNEHS